MEREERNGMHLVRQFCTLSSTNTEHSSTSRELPLTHTLLSELDNDKEIDQLELDWITWQRDYILNKTWGDSRTSILKAMHENDKF